MPTKPTIAIGGILIECNHLGGITVGIDWFERTELKRGNELLEQAGDGDGGVVGGMLKVLRDGGAAIAPLLFASGCPGGPLSAECYAQLKQEILGRLSEKLPVDGVLLPLHGAMTAEGEGDPEGDLIEAVRQMVGAGIPIVVTLDLHAHVTERMVKHADALLGWETYPHRDAFSTGERGARLLLQMLRGECRPTMAMGKVPVITGAINGSTEGDGPFAELMRLTKSYESRDAVLSTSLFLTHPYLDLPAMGSGAVVVTDDDLDLAIEIAAEIANRYWDKRLELEPEVWTPIDAIRAGKKIDGGPILLIEAADCCGGGAAGDSVATLRALIEEAPHELALVPVVDLEVAAAAHRAGVGNELTIELGHRHDPQWGRPVTVTGRVSRLGDGRFTYTGGIWNGVEGNMGPCAVLQIDAIQVLVTSHPTYDWKDEQFRSMDLDPLKAKFIVAKNPMNYHVAYGEVACGTFVLSTRGPTPATVKHVAFKNLARPYFPADVDIRGMKPAIFC